MGGMPKSFGNNRPPIIMPPADSPVAVVETIAAIASVATSNSPAITAAIAELMAKTILPLPNRARPALS